MSSKEPDWLHQVRDFCRDSGIKIMAWGPNMVVVEAKSEDRARVIASQLGQFGLKAIQDDTDAYAGMLSLSKGPI
jgi:hypothetical protein